MVVEETAPLRVHAIAFETICRVKIVDPPTLRWNLANGIETLNDIFPISANIWRIGQHATHAHYSQWLARCDSLPPIGEARFLVPDAAVNLVDAPTRNFF